MKNFPGKIRMVVKQYPYRYRDFSIIASEAALAAGEQGKFWEMHHLLLLNSPDLDRGNLLRCAREIGLDLGKFTNSLDGAKHAYVIERDRKLAESLDLYSTPTYFINGRKVVGDRDYEYLREIVEEELAAAK
ncbi:MAG: thioredoxin domain-containing protein [Deltaproteobacteria bacterium]|nr:thioredoxin domain-containing protein [Deltaproteobacteria bacterium]